METEMDTPAAWQDGKLAPRLRSRRFEMGRTQWLEGALLVLCAGVLAAFVGVLETDVRHGEMARDARHESAAGGPPLQAIARVSPAG
jgi:hypothetical protein